MADLGNINVKIGAVTKGLDAGLAKAKNSLSNFSNQVKLISGVTAKVSAAVGVAGASIVGLTTVSANAAREIRTLSRVAGAAPEQLQRMAFAARSVNVEQEKLADILKDTQDRVGDFIQTGGGPMLDFFENIAPKIGMTAKEFQHLSGPEALQKFYNGLERSNLSMSEQIFHMEAMASDASRLIPLLRDNGAGFAEMAAQADRLGIVLSDIEVEQLAQTGDAISSIGDLFKSAGNEIALKFSPMINAATKAIKGMIESSGGIKDIVGGAFNAVIGIIGKFLDALGDIKLGYSIITRETMQFGLEARKVFFDLTKDVAKFTGVMDDIDIGMKEADMLEAQRNINLLGKAIDEEFSKPLPSENLEDWLARQDAIAKQAAENAININKAMGSVGGGQFDNEGNPINSAEQEAMEAQLEVFRESLRSQEESEIESHKRRLKELALFLENKLITEADYNKLLENEKARHEAVKENIYKTARQKELSFEEMSLKQKAKIINSHLQSITQGVSQQNKALFRINQVSAISQAIIAAYEGISLTMSKYPFPLNIAMASAHAAKAFAQVNAIKGASYGGGAASAPSLAGSTAATPVSNVNGGQSSSRLDINLSGVSGDQLFSGDQVRGLINRINDELDDGAVLGRIRFN